MTDKPSTKTTIPMALPGTGAVLRWIRGLPVEDVDWRSFPGLGIRGGIDGCTPTVTHNAAGRCRWDIPAISGACLSPIGVHVYNEADMDLDEAIGADLDPWNTIHYIMRQNGWERTGRHTDLAAWEILVDSADHIDKKTTTKRLSSDGTDRKALRIRETHTTITRALLARTRPATAVIADQRLHPVV